MFKITILDFDNRINDKTIKVRFEIWVLLPSSGKNEGKEQKTYLLKPLVEPASIKTRSTRRNNEIIDSHLKCLIENSDSYITP
jgi:hypothetical protein